MYYFFFYIILSNIMTKIVMALLIIIIKSIRIKNFLSLILLISLLTGTGIRHTSERGGGSMTVCKWVGGWVVLF